MPSTVFGVGCYGPSPKQYFNSYKKILRTNYPRMMYKAMQIDDANIRNRLSLEIARVEKEIDAHNAKPHRLEKAVRHACEEQERILDILYRIAGIPARGISLNPVMVGGCELQSSNEDRERWPEHSYSCALGLHSEPSAEQLEAARRYQQDLTESIK